MLDTKEENSELILEEFFKFLKENKKYPSKCDSDSEQNRLYNWYENIKLSNPEFLKRIRKFARKNYIFLKYSPSKSNKDRKEQNVNYIIMKSLTNYITEGSNELRVDASVRKLNQITYTFYLGNMIVGGADVRLGYMDGFEQMYDDTIDNLDVDSLRRFFDYNDKTAEIADFWINGDYRKKGLAKPALKQVISHILNPPRNKQIVLRSLPYGSGLNAKDLEKLYESLGFKPIVDTGSEGIIMGYVK